MGKKLTTAEWITKARMVHGNKYDYSKSVYIGSNKKITITCPIHGDFETYANCHISRGDGCPKCTSISKSKALRLTSEEFIKRLKNIYGDFYDYSEVNYSGIRSEIILICPIHGKFIRKADSLLKGRGCPKCKEQDRLQTCNEHLINKYIDYFPDLDYSKTKYIGYDKKVTITCPKHGDFQVYPLNFLKSKGCPKCSMEHHGKNMSKSYEDFIKDAKYIHGDKYDYSKVEYINCREKVCIICPEHGEFWQTPNSHIQGSGCPNCSNSKGEMLICNFLLYNNIKFIREYSIPCKINLSGYALVDFYLPDLNCFIEFNGIQHYKSVHHFGGSLKLEQQQARDEELRQYCKDNNINLIEIRYDEDVWEILNEKLCK
jgi:Zn ribbon nucleic-acid-binding protein